MKVICDHTKTCGCAVGCKHGEKHDPCGVGCEKDFCARAGIDGVQCIPVPEPRDVREIVKAHLVENGYDGLVNQDGECACFMDNLFLCCEPGLDCQPGHEVPCDCSEECLLVFGGLKCRHIAPGRKESDDDE